LENNIDYIKKMVIKALFADNDFLDLFVLKGGNALALAYSIPNRSSFDIDVSMEEDFPISQEMIKQKMEIAFEKVFKNTLYKVFDFKLIQKPKTMDKSKEGFWGGYCLEFKIIEKEKYNYENVELTRKIALPLGTNGTKAFKVDISKYEYVREKEHFELDGFYIYVYTPIMIINEKLRAICQQMNEYQVETNKKPRPRDFYDIFLIFENIIKDKSLFYSEHNKLVIKEMFDIKKVPLELLSKVQYTKDFHETDYSSLKMTVPDPDKIMDFSFYFEYVLKKINELDTFWKK